MKREHHHLHPRPEPPSMSAASSTDTYLNTGKAKLWEDDAQLNGGTDELLAVLGYKIKSSDMADVAHKLEQLEEALCHVQDPGLSQLAFDTVHYNPSDLSTWLESMLTELHPPPPNFAQPPSSHLHDSSFFTAAESSAITSIDYDPQRKTSGRIFEESSSSDYDLQAITRSALYPPRENKRFKHSSDSNSDLFSNSAICASDSVTRPVVLVDSQENGIQLVHALMACAEAVQKNDLNLADALVKRIGNLAVSQAGAMRMVATFFAEALARRIYKVCPENPIDRSMSDMLRSHFYESCPYLKFAHFTANQAILEALEGKKRVHVIDFSMNQGRQWPALMQALARQPSGPPAFRLTGIGPPASDNSDYLQEVGWKLAKFAETFHVEFEYRGFVANSLADLDASMLELRPSEVESVVVNSVFELHKLLARPGAIEKVLSVVKQIKPEIMTMVEQEANHNGPVFMDRFTESLHYYSTFFDSLEGSPNNQDKIMSEMYLGNQICNVVACEGADRVERHETLSQWRTRLSSAGFEPTHLGSNAFKQASMLLAFYVNGDGYRVEENQGSLTLGWHTRPLIATSAWKLGNNSVAAH